MEDYIKTITWQQCGATIDMLENAIRECPDELWSDRSRRPEYWYVAYHTLFWLDFYLDNSPGTFVPRAPFTLEEMDPAGIIPENPFSKDELLTYLQEGREKSRAFIARLTDETMREEVAMASYKGSRFELVVYSLRHVQHHTAQLNLILRQQIDSAPRWVGRTKTPLGCEHQTA